MKEILHKKRDTLNQRGKIVTIIENSQDEECVTAVRKNFIYVVGEPVDVPGEAAAPEIKIKKSFDTKTREEKFAFHIKGTFYVNRDRRMIRILYCHSLKIYLKWKSKVYSPKKSVTVA